MHQVFGRECQARTLSPAAGSSLLGHTSACTHPTRCCHISATRPGHSAHPAQVSETGGSDWKFESLGEGQRAVDKKDSFVFWTLLYATPAVWCVLGLVAILKLNIDYLILVVIAVLLG